MARLIAAIGAIGERARPLAARCEAERLCEPLRPTLRDFVLPRLGQAESALRGNLPQAAVTRLAASIRYLDGLTRLLEVMAEQRRDPGARRADRRRRRAGGGLLPAGRGILPQRRHPAVVGSDRDAVRRRLLAGAGAHRRSDRPGAAAAALGMAERGPPLARDRSRGGARLLRQRARPGRGAAAAHRPRRADGARRRWSTRGRHAARRRAHRPPVAPRAGRRRVRRHDARARLRGRDRGDLRQPRRSGAGAAAVEGDGERYDVHPPGHVRVAAVCRLLARMGFGALGEESRSAGARSTATRVSSCCRRGRDSRASQDEPFIEQAVAFTTPCSARASRR